MIRKEQILQAARDYVSSVTFSSPSDVIHFENGAKWADEHPNLESLWHDASEEPQDGYLLIEFGENKYDTLLLRHYFGESIWKIWCREKKIIRWAYISDLFPKGGEK